MSIGINFFNDDGDYNYHDYVEGVKETQRKFLKEKLGKREQLRAGIVEKLEGYKEKGEDLENKMILEILVFILEEFETRNW